MSRKQEHVSEGSIHCPHGCPFTARDHVTICLPEQCDVDPLGSSSNFSVYNPPTKYFWIEPHFMQGSKLLEMGPRISHVSDSLVALAPPGLTLGVA
jgi:hypothetical protein